MAFHVFYAEESASNIGEGGPCQYEWMESLSSVRPMTKGRCSRYLAKLQVEMEDELPQSTPDGATSTSPMRAHSRNMKSIGRGKMGHKKLEWEGTNDRNYFTRFRIRPLVAPQVENRFLAESTCPETDSRPDMRSHG